MSFTGEEKEWRCQLERRIITDDRGRSLDEQHEELAEIAEQLEHDKIRGVA